jgi:hypothetical protein
MAEKLFDRETILDLTVNFIPLGILLFFMVAYVVVAPWGTDPLISGLQFSIIGVTFVLLAILTYYSGKAISKAEKEMEAEEGHETGASGN